MHAVIEQVTQTIRERSQASRQAYLDKINRAKQSGRYRGTLPCGNLAHGFAACSSAEKDDLTGAEKPNVAIISSYNDMLSAHQPLQDFPDIIKKAIAESGGVAQFAGGVPAMCDGVTQGEPGMELSLFSRDLIAMSTAIGLSHNMFDAALYLGVCDKIVPGLLIGALSFGHLPALFVPAGPMPSGIPNKEKARARQKFAEGKISRQELLAAESASYHSPGTCTFYGTANSNQMLVEIMGLHLPGSSFINPNTPLRDALTAEAGKQILKFTADKEDFRPIGEVIDEKAIVNGMVGLLATGGSTNHTIHLIAIAKAAGVIITWDDFSTLSAAVPLITKIYPNGQADINHFQAAGGMGCLIHELLQSGLLHSDVIGVADKRGMEAYLVEPKLNDANELTWQQATTRSHAPDVLTSTVNPFHQDGGLRALSGNLGRAVVKTSAVETSRYIVEAPAKIFNSQQELQAAFKRDELNEDFIAVVRFQGPRANGMPELHKLTPVLGVLQDRGYRVALVTDGRMSGASGKVPAAIHVTPECASGGPLAKVREGDLLRLDAVAGTLQALVDDAEFDARELATADLSGNEEGMGRELFSAMRAQVGCAEEGASCFSVSSIS